MTAQKALILIGSPRGAISTSHTLGTYLLDRLADESVPGSMLHLHRHIYSQEGRAALLQSTSAADLLILVAPLYVDALPSHVIRAMEYLAEESGLLGNQAGRRLATIMNCGFPEPQHNEYALRICEQFASEVGLEWCGGLSLGGGGAIGNRPLDQTGGMGRKVREALTLAAGALARGERIPQEAVKAMSTPLMSPRLYVTISETGWRTAALKAGVLLRLGARPYGQ